jgi:alpha-glucosidase
MANFFVGSRLHVKIYDAEEQVYQVPESVFPRPSSESTEPSNSAFAFSWTENPFSFKVARKTTNETLFDSSAATFIFETQYLRLRTRLPESPNLYGLGEHTDPFQLNTTNYTRTVSFLFKRLHKDRSDLSPVMEPRLLWCPDGI